MAKERKCHEIFDEVRQIDIAWLRNEGLLEPGRRVNGWLLSWKCGSRVVIDVDTTSRFLRLTDGFGRDQRSYTVLLEGRPSNLGKGHVWYFVCPVTGRLCRKLYRINGYFFSRYAYPTATYRSRTEPKGDRKLRKYITLNGTIKNPKAEWDFFNRKHYRTTYNGNPTKRYLKYLERTRKIKALLGNGLWEQTLAGLRATHEKLRESLFSVQSP
jgi:hypothetical protein